MGKIGKIGAWTDLAEDEHVLALLMRHPVDGLLRLRRLVHSLQVFFQNFLMKSDLERLWLT
jgi:hypothetical protein